MTYIYIYIFRTPIWSTSVLFDPYVLFGPLQFYQVHFGLIRSTLALFYTLHSYMVHFDPLQSYSVHSIHLGSIRYTSVLLGPNCSYSVQYVYFGSNLSTSVPFDPIQCKFINYVLFSPPCSHSVLFCPFGPLWSILVDLHIGKRHAWVESTYFKYKFIKKYIDLKLVILISKILSITFIISTILLSHINVAFQTTSVTI